MRKSLKSHFYHDFAAAILYLACKLNDVHIRLKDFILFHHRNHHKNDDLLMSEQEYTKWKNTFIYLEEYTLVTLCFDMDTENPFLFFLEIRQKIKDLYPELVKHYPVIAWSFLLDIFHSALVIQYPIKSIVVAAWSLSSKAIPFHKESKNVCKLPMRMIPPADHYQIQGADIHKLKYRNRRCYY